MNRYNLIIWLRFLANNRYYKDINIEEAIERAMEFFYPEDGCIADRLMSVEEAVRNRRP